MKENLKLVDVMTREVVTVDPSDTVYAAAAKMRANDVGPLPVCEDGKVIGMITDRDITVRTVAEGRDPKHAQVRDVMSSNVAFCYEDQDLADAARVMKDRQIRRLPILARDRRLVGIVSLADLAAHGALDTATDTFGSLSQTASHRHPR